MPYIYTERESAGLNFKHILFLSKRSEAYNPQTREIDSKSIKSWEVMELCFQSPSINPHC